jgi:hypothetical protein
MALICMRIGHACSIPLPVYDTPEHALENGIRTVAILRLCLLHCESCHAPVERANLGAGEKVQQSSSKAMACHDTPVRDTASRPWQMATIEAAASLTERRQMIS